MYFRPVPPAILNPALKSGIEDCGYAVEVVIQ